MFQRAILKELRDWTTKPNRKPLGRLKSLHQFMDLAPHQYAVRFYAGPLTITQSTSTNGRPYQLLNLPYYLATQLAYYLDWFIEQ
jgi:uncharacterized protein